MASPQKPSTGLLGCKQRGGTELALVSWQLHLGRHVSVVVARRMVKPVLPKRMHSC